MSGEALRQRLAAILAADAVGYSRLMAADERATVAALDAGRAVFRREIEANQGRVIDMAGDAVLAVFETAAGAVSTALEVQRALADLAKDLPADRRMRFRIGVHLGDVIEKADGTIYGDGVNIAARLQALAAPEAVVISDAVCSAVRGKVEADFEDQGDQSLKNISAPVRTFLLKDRNAAATAGARESSEGEEKASKQPSIAVLPFELLSDDPQLRFLADGLVEDVIALLARAPGFLVISHASSSLFRNAKAVPQSIAKQLGVRYVVSGSVRQIGDRLRCTAQLSDGESGQVSWSGRFEAAWNETDDLQEGIARAVMCELEPALIRTEIAVIRRQRPENLDAWGCYQQATAALALKSFNESSIEEARAALLRAVAIDPSFALAHANFSLITAVAINVGFIEGRAAASKMVREFAERALALDDASSQVLGYAGCALCDIGRSERGTEMLEHSLILDPSNAQAHVALGAAQALAGDVGTGAERMRYGMRISPRDRRLAFWGWVLGRFLLRAGETELALAEARTSIRRDPNFYLARLLEAHVLAQTGRDPAARKALMAARGLRKSLSLAEIRKSHGRRAVEVLAPLWDPA